MLEREWFPTKETLYLLGEYHRMLGNRTAARNYFKRALRSFVNQPIEVCLVVLAATLGVATGFLLGRIKGKVVVKACAGLAMGALLIGSFKMYEELKRVGTPDEYYDDLIRDQMGKLRDRSVPAAEAKQEVKQEVKR